MKQRQGWIIGAALGCLLVAGMGQVEAKQLRFNGNFAGTSLHSRIDRNDDGLPANWSTGVTTGTPGKRIFQSLYEVVPTGPRQRVLGAYSSSMRKTGRDLGPSPKPSLPVTNSMHGYSLARFVPTV